jgi:hypothetical protein
MSAPRFEWRLFALGRRDYWICAGLLVAITALLPVSFIFVGAPAGWLLLFTARVQDIGKSAWSWPALAIVGLEMFGRSGFRYVAEHYSRSTAGYLFIGLVVLHLVFAVALGLQRSRAAPDGSKVG